MDSNIVVIPVSVDLKINDITKSFTVKPLSIFATMSLIKDIEKEHKDTYKKEIIEISKELTGKDKVDFLTNSLNSYTKIDGSQLLNTSNGYIKILQTVTKLSNDELNIVINDVTNSDNITIILKTALDIKDESVQVIEEQKKIV
jgi:hypothetical protein